VHRAWLVATLLAAAPGPALAQSFGAPAEQLGRVELGAALGFGHQTEMWVAGLRGGVRGIGTRYVEAAATLLGGYAAEHFVARLSLHARFTVEGEGFRFYPLVGPGLYAYAPRGRFAEWCDKLQLDECRGVDIGLEAGLGAGFRFLAFEVYLGTGPLPFLTLLLSGSFTL
jgi:hypothetical protein